MLVEIRELIRLAAFVGYNKSRPLFRVGVAPTQLSFSRVPTFVARERVVPGCQPCIAAGIELPSAWVSGPRFPPVSPPRCRSGPAPRRPRAQPRTQSGRTRERRLPNSSQNMKTLGLHKVRFRAHDLLLLIGSAESLRLCPSYPAYSNVI